MNRTLRILAVFSLLLCVLCVMRGLWGMSWPGALPWQGREALLRFLTYLALVAGMVIVFASVTRRSALVVGAALGVGLTVLAGVTWPLIVAAWFYFASSVLGRVVLRTLGAELAEPSDSSSFLVGAGVYGFMVGVLAHFPVNFPGVYGLGLLLPLVLDRQSAKELALSVWGWALRKDDSGATGRAIEFGLVAITLVYLVMALLPEVGFDSLAMHLFIPSQLFYRNQWGFDASTYVWAVMPLMADWLYSIGYMLGGETAARLINLTFVFVLASLARELAVWAGGAANTGRLAALLVISTPLTLTQGSTLHVEGVWAAFLCSSTLAILKLTTAEQGRGHYLAVAGLTLGCALATKAITLLMLPLLGVILIFRWRSWVRPEVFWAVVAGVSLVVVIGAFPYVDALRLTGNPVFPFFNQIFQSPFFPPENFRDMRWIVGLTWDALPAITFHSDRYQEAMPGAPGFQWVVFFLPTLLLLLGGKAYRGLVLMLVGSLFVVLVFRSTSYLRYIFPVVALLSAAIAVAIERATSDGGAISRAPFLGGLLLVLFLNVLFLSSAARYGDFPLRPIFDVNARDEYIAARVPVRAAVDLVNRLNPEKRPVAFLADPFGAGLKGDALYANWYNRSFLDGVSRLQSDADALNFLVDRTVDYLILDKAWGRGNLGQGRRGEFEAQREHLENVTTEVAVMGSISVRKLRTDLRFREELLKNSDFSSKDGWAFATGAFFDSSAHLVLVSEPSPVTQQVSVKGGRHYRNKVVARCAEKPAQGRLQINWHDANGRFIKADGVQFDCAREWTEHEMTVVAPSTAAVAVVYTAGHAGERVAYKRNSLLQ